MSKSDPILVRVYKKEAELEVWKKTDGHYAMLKSFPICRWSGQLGPKVREGDRQAPEGFYTIAPGQMNPNSAYYLSFDTGYPNAYDRAHNRSGSYLMVHGTCSSRGCYAMTDEGIAEVYALARESFAGGQKGFQFQAYPFRMTADNLARYRQDPNMPFWKNLKQGSDHFEVTKREPKVAVCKGRYAFDTVGSDCAADPTLAPAVAQKEEADNREVADLVAKGTPAVRLVYADGGQHDSFRSSSASASGDAGSNFAILDVRPRRNLGDVSRPEALAEGPREIAMDAPKAAAVRPSTRIAALSKSERQPKATAEKTAKTGRTVLASADPDEPISAPAAEPETRPFYQRVMGRVLGDTTTVSEPVQSPRTADPAPDKGTAAKGTAAKGTAAKGTAGKDTATKAKATAVAPVAKPKTGLKTDAKTSSRATAAKQHASAGHLVPATQPVGPSTTAFRTN